MSDETTTPQDGDMADDDATEATAAEETAANDADADAAPSPEALRAEIDAMRDHMLRAVADADNTRKRAEREIADTRAYAVANFARDLLSVADNLQRALSALPPEARESMGDAGRNLLAGVEITERELQAALQRHGVTPIDVAPGTTFDPNLHQAAAQIPSDQPAGAVVEVIQSGWVIGDRVLRAAMVAVSSGPAAGGPNDQSGDHSGSGTNGASDPDAGAGPGMGANLDTKI